MKKFEIHLDALIVIVVVFALAATFLLYQRHQYSVVLQENLDLRWDNSGLEANLAQMTVQLENCQSNLNLMEEREDAPDAAVEK